MNCQLLLSGAWIGQHVAQNVGPRWAGAPKQDAHGLTYALP
jgi:hypothetical protein